MPAENNPIQSPIFSKMLAHRHEADELWNNGQEPFVRHGNFEENLLSNLMNARVPLDKLGEIFTKEGKIIEKKGCDFSYEQVGYSGDGRELIYDSDRTDDDIKNNRISVEGFYNILKARYKTIFSLINPSTDQGYEGGFNNHGGDEHIIPVTDAAWEMVKQVNGTVEEQKLVVAAGLSHDLGVLLTRKTHSFASSRLAFALVPELKQDFKTALQIRKTIILHNDDVAIQWMDILAYKHGTDTKEFYTTVREKFGVAALALIAADSADAVDRRRATKKQGVDASKIAEDAQTLTAALADQRGYQKIIIPGGGEPKEIQTRQLLFNPFLSEEEEHNLRNQGNSESPEEKKKHDNEIFIPVEYRNLNRKHGIPHKFSWMADIWKYHVKRFGLESRALFALFPHLDTYHLIVEDNSAWNKVGYKSSFTYEVNHAEVAEVVDFLANKMAFPERKPRIIDTIPFVYINEANKIRDINLKGLLMAYRNGGSDSARIKRTLWRSQSDQSRVVARYDFNTEVDIKHLKTYMAKLFKPHSVRAFAKLA